MLRCNPKPITVKAKLYTNENLDEILKFCGDSCYVENGVVYLKTLEGDEELVQGEYVVRGVMGEFTACEYTMFKSVYTYVSEDTWEKRGIVAVHYTGRNFSEIRNFTKNIPERVAYDWDAATGRCKIPHPGKTPYTVRPGDYIIWKGNSMYPCRADIFYQTYNVEEA